MNIDKIKKIREAYVIKPTIPFARLLDALIDEPEPFDPFKLKVDQKGYVWNGDERPEKPGVRKFSHYLPAARCPYCCFLDGKEQATATGTCSWQHFEPIGDDDEKHS